ncbi:MAG: hypothetical protein AW10_02985 [Candidatus Accumulibacter appositus]|uniref:Uncharacterized protein n=1 Tax=Candidatus Accumulibacter appositus TaxID=1454003 RepID=A0A011N7P5_9PROT|nr:MAG: hypothetical protein AW10_02985 [Candidatus Accumulibacter appositus]
MLGAVAKGFDFAHAVALSPKGEAVAGGQRGPGLDG